MQIVGGTAAPGLPTPVGVIEIELADGTRLRITVAVTKVVRAAEDAFEIHWEERILETGAPVRWERFTGAVSILFSSPKHGQVDQQKSTRARWIRAAALRRLPSW